MGAVNRGVDADRYVHVFVLVPVPSSARRPRLTKTEIHNNQTFRTRLPWIRGRIDIYDPGSAFIWAFAYGNTRLDASEFH